MRPATPALAGNRRPVQLVRYRLLSLSLLLRLLPVSLHRALDAWSYRVALARAARRRSGSRRRSG